MTGVLTRLLPAGSTPAPAGAGPARRGGRGAPAGVSCAREPHGCDPHGHGHAAVHRHRGLDPAVGSRAGGAWPAALRRHDEILRAAIEHAGGYVFKTVGDAFCAAFATAEAALGAVLAAQRALAARAVADQPADPGADGPAHRRVRGARQRLLRPGRQPDGPAGGRRARRSGAGLRRHGRAAVRQSLPDGVTPAGSRPAPAEGPRPARAGVPAGGGASCRRTSRRWRRWTTRSCRTTCPAC